MIKGIRVDHRLLHGQVAFAWTSHVGCDCILLVSETVLDEPLRLSAIKLAKPTGVKLVIKNTEDSITALKDGRTDKYKLFIVTETIESAVRIMKETGHGKLVLGGTRPEKDKKKIASAMYVTDEEQEMLRGLVANGQEVVIQMLPTNHPVRFGSTEE